MGEKTKLILVASGAGSHKDKGHRQEHLEDGKRKDGRKTRGIIDHFLHQFRVAPQARSLVLNIWKDPWQANQGMSNPSHCFSQSLCHWGQQHRVPRSLTTTIATRWEWLMRIHHIWKALVVMTVCKTSPTRDLPSLRINTMGCLHWRINWHH